MPQLLGRMDNLNWLTPSIADVLDQGPPPPSGDGTIRELVTWLQQRLSDLDIPVRIVNVRATTTHTLFILRSDNKENLPKDIQQGIAKISDEKQDWKIGFIPQLSDVPDAMGILLRTSEHTHLGLRRILVRSTYRDHPSRLAIAVGNTLEQLLIVEDLAQSGNLLVVGAESQRTNYTLGLLTTLLILNTPGELRLVLISTAPRAGYDGLADCPHMIGSLTDSIDDIQALFDGLQKEIRQRNQWFKAEGVENFGEYNQTLVKQNKLIIPRVVVVIDSISDSLWKQSDNSLRKRLASITEKKGKQGIHIILLAQQFDDLTDGLQQQFQERVFLRSGDDEIFQGFHNSLNDFIDGVYINSTNKISPIEVPVVTPEEVKNTVTHWVRIDKQRTQGSKHQKVSGKTGVTKVLSAAKNERVSTVPPAESIPSLQPSDEGVYSVSQTSLQQAQALASYLGWIGLGPLQDIFGLSPGEAAIIVKTLREMGIVEDNSSTTPRFVRPLSAVPPPED